jgi:hypothetical protein
MDQRKRYLWDLRGAKGYEVQTSARKDSIEMNKDKGKLWSVPMVWVASGKEVLDEIAQLTKDTSERLDV